ncbi:MAG TPA: hypothetical protein ENI20_00160 [Bacteroides sp.]|nr:hypothetical protein [Bacteroides sp.]
MRIIFLISLSLLSLHRSSAQAELELILDPDINYQTMHSFGASDSWAAQFFGKNYPLEKREKMAEWLFSKEFDENGNPSGIGLSLWRFNIGTGGAQLGDSSRMHWNWRRTDCFRDADGNWDWSKQEGQQWFLNKAREYGVEYYKAIVYSPPYWWTRNGLNISAPEETLHMNIQPEKISEYASFLADILQHFQDEGTPFDYLSPFNEPEWDWSGGLAEGSPASNDELYTLIKELDREFSKRKLSTKMLIGDAGDHRYLFSDFNNDKARGNKINYFYSPSSPSYLGNLPNVEKAISSHSYHSVWPVDTLILTRKRITEKISNTNADISFWQTEYCILQQNDDIGNGWRRDLGINTALYVARIIHHDLSLANASSWQFWTAMTHMNFKGGLIYVDAGEGNQGSTGPRDKLYESLKYDGEIRDSKILWALGNYSHFIRPGMHRINAEFANRFSLTEQATDLMVSAFRDPVKKDIVIVFVNYSGEEKSVHLPDNEKYFSLHSYITSEDKNLEYVETRGKLLNIPARSVLTLLMEENILSHGTTK